MPVAVRLTLLYLSHDFSFALQSRPRNEGIETQERKYMYRLLIYMLCIYGTCYFVSLYGYQFKMAAGENLSSENDE